MASIHPSISRTGKWTLEPYGFESVTNNQSESFNCVLKHLQHWKEVPVDSMALSLYRLSQYHVCEVFRGRHGVGEYHLRPQLVNTYNGTSASVPHATPPEEIVAQIRRAVLSSTDSNQTASSTSSSPDAGDMASTASVQERAADLVQTNRIRLDPQLATFICQGTIEPRVVRLFPTASCSCPAVDQCYHITAARIAVGIKDAPSKRKVNLTQLRKNTRKRPDKTAGRKRPRVADEDVEPAGDTDAATHQRFIDAVSGMR